MFIVEEGSLPHPLCPRCEILPQQAALNIRHINTSQCSKGEYKKQYRLAMEEARAGMEVEFLSYVLPLTNVVVFKYLGRILTSTVND